jgi:hypothetical protein
MLSGAPVAATAARMFSGKHFAVTPGKDHENYVVPSFGDSAEMATDCPIWSSPGSRRPRQLRTRCNHGMVANRHRDPPISPSCLTAKAPPVHRTASNFLGLDQRNPMQKSTRRYCSPLPRRSSPWRISGERCGCSALRHWLHTVIRRAILLWPAEVRAAASRHKWPRNADLVFTGLRNGANIFSNSANLSPHDQGYQR